MCVLLYSLRGRNRKRKLLLQRYVCYGDIVIWYDMFDILVWLVYDVGVESVLVLIEVVCIV